MISVGVLGVLVKKKKKSLFPKRQRKKCKKEEETKETGASRSVPQLSNTLSTPLPQERSPSE